MLFCRLRNLEGFDESRNIRSVNVGDFGQLDDDLYLNGRSLVDALRTTVRSWSGKAGDESMLRRPCKRTSISWLLPSTGIRRSLAFARPLVNPSPFCNHVPSRASSRLRINQRHLGQLQIDEQTDSPVDLEK